MSRVLTVTTFQTSTGRYKLYTMYNYLMETVQKRDTEFNFRLGDLPNDAIEVDNTSIFTHIKFVGGSVKYYNSGNAVSLPRSIVVDRHDAASAILKMFFFNASMSDFICSTSDVSLLESSFYDACDECVDAAVSKNIIALDDAIGLKRKVKRLEQANFNDVFPTFYEVFQKEIGVHNQQIN